MGTRADFYVGVGPDAEWLGSIAWDGYPSGIPADVLGWADAGGFRESVADFIESRDDGTTPDQGWPWPWDDSGTTEFTYAFHRDAVWVSSCGDVMVRMRDYDHDAEEQTAESIPFDFPNMKDRQNVTFGDRSGVIVVKG